MALADTWDSGALTPWQGVSTDIALMHPVYLSTGRFTPVWLLNDTELLWALEGDDVIALDEEMEDPYYRFYQYGAYVGTPIPQTMVLERTGLVIDSQGIRPSEMKLITGIYPVIEAPLGTVLTFEIGGELGQPSSGVTFSSPYTYTVGISTKIDCVITCRYPAFRVSYTGTAEVVLQAIGWEIEGIGSD